MRTIARTFLAMSFVLCFVIPAFVVRSQTDERISTTRDIFDEAWRLNTASTSEIALRFGIGRSRRIYIGETDIMIGGETYCVRPLTRFKPSDKMRDFLTQLGWVWLELNPYKSKASQLEKILNDPDIIDVMPNYLVKTAELMRSQDDDPDLWNLENDGKFGLKGVDVGARAVTRLYANNPLPLTPVVVAVIDTEIDYTHPELAGHIAVNDADPINELDDDGNGVVDDYYGYNAVDNSGKVFDFSGENNQAQHGTHVASIIAGNSVGVLGEFPVFIRPIKFLGLEGGTISGAVNALLYALDQKINGQPIRISNNSWHVVQNRDTKKQVNMLKDILKLASTTHDHLFCFASGNEFADIDAFPKFGRPSSFSYKNILTSAAIDRFGSLGVFSNYGKKNVDVGAPGVQIYSATPFNTYSTFDGTSMASPHTAGAVALTLMLDQTLSAFDAGKFVMKKGKKLTALQGKTATGKVPKLDKIYKYFLKKAS